MKGSTRGTAFQLVEMARQAQEQLAIEHLVVNALNVFPVPDGDTGSNMLATIREALRQAEDASDAAAAAEQLARGALLGARGNSGVILSQLFRAQHEELTGSAAEKPRSEDLAAVLRKAAELARAVVSNPIEGTMLSVLEAAAQVAPGDSLEGTLLRLLAATEEALAATPEQLPILREAGVVDSGGYGLLLVFRGWYEALVDKPPPDVRRELLGLARVRGQVAAGTAHPADMVVAPSGGYGYCITLLVDAPGAGEGQVRQRLSQLGDSVLVTAGRNGLKLHLHAPNPDPVQSYARELGSIVSSEISNIDEQTAVGAPPIPILAVVDGEGLGRVFQSLGAAVVTGGAGRDPSTAELLDAAQARLAPVFVLPNNTNILNTARQASAVSPDLEVVPAQTIPQGVAALLAYDPSSSPDENRARMAEAATRVTSAEIVRAARHAEIGGMAVQSGQLMVLLEGRLLGLEDPGLDALATAVAQQTPRLVTIYCGAAASEAGAQAIGGRLRSSLPDLEVEVVRGDQPHSDFILGFE